MSKTDDNLMDKDRPGKPFFERVPRTICRRPGPVDQNLWDYFLHAKRGQNIINPAVLGLRPDYQWRQAKPEGYCKDCSLATLLSITTYIDYPGGINKIPKSLRSLFLPVEGEPRRLYLRGIPLRKRQRSQCYYLLLRKGVHVQTVFGISFRNFSPGLAWKLPNWVREALARISPADVCRAGEKTRLGLKLLFPYLRLTQVQAILKFNSGRAKYNQPNFAVKPAIWEGPRTGRGDLHGQGRGPTVCHCHWCHAKLTSPYSHSTELNP